MKNDIKETFKTSLESQLDTNNAYWNNKALNKLSDIALNLELALISVDQMESMSYNTAGISWDPKSLAESKAELAKQKQEWNDTINQLRKYKIK